MLKFIWILFSYVVFISNAYACDYLETSDWIAQYRACPNSAVAAYNAAKTYQLKGDTDQALQIVNRAIKQHPNFVPLRKLKHSLSKDPFTAVALLSAENLKNWVQNYPQPRLNRTPPKKPKLPPLPILTKGEFEKTPAFKQRVEQARIKRQQAIKRIEQRYANAVADYNRAVQAHNRAVQRAVEKRKRELPSKRQQFMAQAMFEVFGSPRFAEVNYDADSEVFYGHLVARNANFEQNIKLAMPISQAPKFKQQLSKVKAAIKFKLKQNQLLIAGIEASHQGQIYAGKFTAQDAQTQVVKVQLEEQQFASFTTLDTMRPEKMESASDQNFFDTALQLEEDPELAELRLQQAKLKREQAELALMEKRERERQRLLAQIKQQELQLAQSGADKYKGLGKPITQWNFKPIKNTSQNIIPVIIGNRNYNKGIPPVHYAHYDAKAMRDFVTSSLGVDVSNLIYTTDATKGMMEGIFKSTLPHRVVPGKSDVLVYFSGHGLSANNDAKLLPADSNPDTAAVTGYSRQQMLQQLAALNARSVTVVLDACYTGTSKEGHALLEGKPIFHAPQAAELPDNVLLITASTGNQIAWMDDKQGHSLLTYHLLKGLQGAADTNRDNVVHGNEMQQYLSQKVNRHARVLHEQEQQPEVRGFGGALAHYYR